MINAEVVRGWEFPALRQAWTEKDAILYALALGYGSDPVDPAQLRYVYEPDLQVVPAFANVLCHPGFWLGDPRTGVDAKRVVHVEQRMQLHAPLPARGTARAQTRVLDVTDKGEGKGALVVFQRKLFDDATGAPLATIEQHVLCRGDGGFSGEPAAASPPRKADAQEPGAPDAVIDIPVLPQAALVYRLSADPNPLHADPAVARAAGFARPILHGLCTFGIACRALLEALGSSHPAALKAMTGRFSAPVTPGEVLRTEIWRGNSENGVRFRCRVPARDTTVLAGGTAEWSTSAQSES